MKLIFSNTRTSTKKKFNFYQKESSIHILVPQPKCTRKDRPDKNNQKAEFITSRVKTGYRHDR